MPSSYGPSDLRDLSLAKIAPKQKSLTLTQRLGHSTRVRDVFRTVAALRSALSTRRDLLLENLALRHQLGVLARSDRRFRASDRLLWLCLRRGWPRWMKALVLVKPATVARWHREGFRGCWRGRSRRPGRPCIDSHLRALIGRLATENRLWGAPRIHGELLKLGVAVSERTVSRYLPDRRTAPSQTWRTFLANHLGGLAFISPMVSSNTLGDDDAVDAYGVSSGPAPLLREAPCTFDQCAVVAWSSSLPSESHGWRVAPDRLHDAQHPRTRPYSGRDPPRRAQLQFAVGPAAYERRSLCPAFQLASTPMKTLRPVARRRSIAMAVLSLSLYKSSTS